MYKLKPSKKVNRIINYCLGMAAKRFGIALHSYGFLSNHFHLVITDVHGSMPKFMQVFDSLVAKAINSLRGQSESIWAPGSYTATWLVTPQAVLEAIVYTQCNPVSSHLVEKARTWPGVLSKPGSLGSTIKEHRPHYFRTDGDLPEFGEHQLTVPPDFEHMPVEDYKKMLCSAVAERERLLVQDARRTGVVFLGLEGIKAQNYDDRPKTKERRGGIRPRVKALDQEAMVEAKSTIKKFEADYRAARLASLSGEPDVTFPYGTYWLRIHCNVPCVAPS